MEKADPRSKEISPKAEAILDKDHYGLEKVKERIIEYLSRAATHEQGDGADLVPGGPSGCR